MVISFSRSLVHFTKNEGVLEHKMSKYCLMCTKHTSKTSNYCLLYILNSKIYYFAYKIVTLKSFSQGGGALLERGLFIFLAPRGGGEGGTILEGSFKDGAY